MTFGDEPPVRPRRSAFVFAVAVAVLLGAGTTVVLTRHDDPRPGRPAPAALSPSADPGPPVEVVVDPPSPAASPSPSPRPRRTSTRPSPKPSTSPPSPGPGPPMPVYAVTKPICRYLDLAPVNALTKPAGKPSVSSNEQHFQGADNTLYYCTGYSGNVIVKRIDVMYYPTPAEAAFGYVQIKSQAPENIEHVDGLGTDTWGWFFDPTSYDLLVLAGNVTMEVILMLSKPAPIGPKVRAAAITIATTLLPKLRVG